MIDEHPEEPEVLLEFTGGRYVSGLFQKVNKPVNKQSSPTPAAGIPGKILTGQVRRNRSASTLVADELPHHRVIDCLDAQVIVMQPGDKMMGHSCKLADIGRTPPCFP